MTASRLQTNAGNVADVSYEREITVTSRPADVCVVSMDDSVLLLVDGPPTDENTALVEEMRASFVSTGTPASEVEVIWQGRRRA